MDSGLNSLRLFGAVDARTATDERAHTVLAQAKHVAFLALLAHARVAPVRRERAIGLLWPELSPERARNALSKAIHNCRRSFGDDAVQGKFSEELSLSPAHWSVDVWAFEDAVARGEPDTALAIYGRGPYLDGLQAVDSAELDHWIDAERSRLARLAAQAARALTEQAERAGDFAGAAREAARLCQLLPFDELALREHMRLLAQAGDHAGALHQFVEFESRLRRELDAHPSNETVALARALRREHRQESSAALPIGMEEGAATSPEAPPERRSAERQVDAAVPASVRPESTPVPPAARVTRLRRLGAVAIGAVTLLTVMVMRRPLNAHDRVAPRGYGVLPVRVAAEDTLARALVSPLVNALAQQLGGIGTAPVHVLTGTDDLASSTVDHLVEVTVEQRGGQVIGRATIRRHPAGNARVALDAISVSRDSAAQLVAALTDQIAGAAAALSDTTFRAWALAGSRVPSYAAYLSFRAVLGQIATREPQQEPWEIMNQLAAISRIDSLFPAARLLFIEMADLLQRSRPLADSAQAVALAMRSRLGAYDAAALEYLASARAGDWEAAYRVALRMRSLAPALPDAHFAVARAQLATRRYRALLASLDTIRFSPGWLAPRVELWQWERFARHTLADFGLPAPTTRTSAVAGLDPYSGCEMELPDLIAARRVAEVDRMVAHCADLVGMTKRGPAKIPNRIYADLVVAHYLAHDQRTAAEAAAARIQPAFDRYVAREPFKARDRAMLDCALERWSSCFAAIQGNPLVSDGMLAIRYWGVSAAHLGDTMTVRLALQRIDRLEPLARPGMAELTRAMIFAAAGRRDTAINSLKRALERGLSPSGMEWQPWPGIGETLGPRNDWYHAFEFASLRRDPIFQQTIRPRE